MRRQESSRKIPFWSSNLGWVLIVPRSEKFLEKIHPVSRIFASDRLPSGTLTILQELT